MNAENVRNIIKSYAAINGITMTEIITLLNKKNDSKDTVQNLSAKLARGTIKYSEVKDIADILGYDIKWVSKK